jgi:hypothetical protein
MQNLGIGGPADTFKADPFRQDIAGLSTCYGTQGEHRRVNGVNFPRNNVMKGSDHLGGNKNGIDATLGSRTVTHFPDNLNIEGLRCGVGLSIAKGDLSRFPSRVAVQAE